MDFKSFAALAAMPAPSGGEDLLAAHIIKTAKPYADDIHQDAMGNVIILKKGAPKGKKLMVAAHMDEVSLCVNYIDDNGFLRFVLLGGIDPRTLLAQRVQIRTQKHGFIAGIIGAKPAHYLTPADKANPITADNLYIDIGYSAAAAKKMVAIGDTATLDRAPIEFGDNLISSKAIDDRAGVYILLEALKKLPKKATGRSGLPGDVYFVFTVQEERGCIGARGAAFGISPDVALAVDTTGALDTPDIAPKDYVLKTGHGIGITLADAHTIAHPGVVKQLKNICAAQKAPYQLRVAARGGNDGKVMQATRRGVPTGILSVPVRYIHSNVEVASKKDIDAAVKLVTAFARQAGGQN